MKRFEALDGIRGVAATMVLMYHIGLVSKCDWLAPYGYLSVDLFFMLSGFVIAAAYERKFAAGMSFFEYMIGIRIPRLYPMIFLGAALGLVAALLGAHSVPTPWILFLKQMFLVPTLLPMEIYPIDNVMWSLALELLINAVHVVAYPHLKTKTLALAVAASLVVLVGAAWHYRGLNAGWNTPTVLGGVPRVCFSFALGLLACRMHQARKLPRVRLGFLTISLIVVVAIALPMPTNAHHIRALHDLAAVTVIFPIVIAAGVNTKIDNKWKSTVSALGEFSYPLYAIHTPIIFLYALALGLPALNGIEKLLTWLPFAFGIVALAWVVDRRVEKPIQDWLHAKRVARRGF